MSELMHLLGETDHRVRPLMTTVKQWAKAYELTRPHPGPWPANFTLLSLLVFYLQSCKVPVLPSLRLLQSLAGKCFCCSDRSLHLLQCFVAVRDV
jgi:poly(A) RNA polymerase